MTKAELIAQVAAKIGQTKAVAGAVMAALLTTVTKIRKKEGCFILNGLVFFEVVKRAKRQARNPRTGEAIVVKARNIKQSSSGWPNHSKISSISISDL